MQNEIAKFDVFSSPEFSQDIRTHMIGEEPWFVGKDVADALGYSNSRKALSDHVDDEDKGVTKCDTPGGPQEVTVINESGVYSLTFSSKLPKARQFKRWITAEVLPALRKKGAYSIINNSTETPLSREEMAMYWTNLMASYQDYTQILERRDAARDKMIDTILAKQTDMIAKVVAAMQSGKASSISDVNNHAKVKTKTNKVAKVNKTIKSSGGVADKEWIKKANESVQLLINKSGKNVGAQNREIYDVMRRNGYVVKPRDGYNTINTISRDKKLSAGFDSAVEELRAKYYPAAAAKSSVPRSILVRKVPDEIAAAIREYAKKNKMSYVYACSQIYKAIEDAAGVSLDKMSREYSKKIGVSTCNKAYMISKDAKLMKVFSSVINKINK